MPTLARRPAALAIPINGPRSTRIRISRVLLHERSRRNEPVARAATAPVSGTWNNTAASPRLWRSPRPRRSSCWTHACAAIAKRFRAPIFAVPQTRKTASFARIAIDYIQKHNMMPEKNLPVNYHKSIAQPNLDGENRKFMNTSIKSKNPLNHAWGLIFQINNV